jgi:hypothetical protein
MAELPRENLQQLGIFILIGDWLEGGKHADKTDNAERVGNHPAHILCS